MNMAQIHNTAAELTQKLKANGEISAQDLKNAEAMVNASGRPEHFTLWGAARSRYFAANQPDEPEPEKVTAAQVEEAEREVKKNGSLINRTNYAVLKQRYAIQEAAEQ
ncbi:MULTISPECIES: hypothetical protein [unclassified Paenibacillus]|uniref:hypothetical protein n=1 Tax=unclassified Paenibacillus TaxID=185978 RepID=UPI0036433F89